MLRIEENISLQPRNTLNVAARAQYLADVTNLEDLAEALAFARQRRLPVSVLGGGSNSVFGGDVPGLMICMVNRGIEVRANTLVAAAGESWHGVVKASLAGGLFGLENLSWIPGRVGAAPIQNIGAYGVELADVLHRVHVMDRQTGSMTSLTAADCKFGYRDSVFKGALANQVIITEVELALATVFRPNIGYADLQAWFAEIDSSGLSGQAVSEAVQAIRQRKLPDPEVSGNVGSFFKNPVIDAELLARLKTRHPGLRAHLVAPGRWKLSAAWLIDSLGLKGLRVGDAVVSSQHALVIENAGAATGEQVLALADVIRARVSAGFNVSLDIEPVVYR